MSPRDRLLAILSGTPNEGVPWAPQLTRTFFLGIAEYASRFASDDLPGPIDHYLVDDELAWRVAWYRSVGAAFVDWLPPAVSVESGRVRRSERRVGDRLVVEVATPVGTLSSELAIVAGSFHPVTWLVRGPEDFPAYEYALRDRRMAPRHEEMARRLAIIGDAGVALANGPSSPVQRLLLGDFGIEATLLALADHPREMASLAAAMHEWNLEMCRQLASSPARVVVTGNVTGTGMMSPAIYREHVLPFQREYASLLREAGKLAVSHASGEPVAPIAAEVKATGVAAVHGLDLGRAEADCLATAWADGPAAWGGLSPAFLAAATPEEAAGRAADVAARAGTRLVLGSTDDCVAGTAAAVFAAVARAAPIAARLGRGA